MSYEYIYTRDIVDGVYNIDNRHTAIVDDLVVPISKSIELILPGKKFICFCSASECKFIFEVELSPSEQSDLTTAVNNYKSL